MDDSLNWKLISNPIVDISAVYDAIKNLQKINDNDENAIMLKILFCDKERKFKLDTGAMTCSNFDDFDDDWKTNYDQGEIELMSAHGFSKKHKLYLCSFVICNSKFNIRCADLGKNLIGADLIKLMKIHLNNFIIDHLLTNIT